jgi:hypothetical protein
MTLDPVKRTRSRFGSCRRVPRALCVTPMATCSLPNGAKAPAHRQRRSRSVGWLPQRTDPVATLQDALNFFGVAPPEALSQIGKEKCVAFRQSSAHQVDQYALLAWIRKGEIEAQQQPCAPFDEKGFRRALAEIRKLTRETVDSYVPRMAQLCTASGVALVFVPEIPGLRAWGVTHWLSPDKAVLQLSLRGKTDDHLWFVGRLQREQLTAMDTPHRTKDQTRVQSRVLTVTPL